MYMCIFVRHVPAADFVLVANAGSAKEPERPEARRTGSAAKDLENEEGLGRRTTGLLAQPT